MPRRANTLASLAFLALVAPVTSTQAQAGQGSIVGRVIDERKAPVPVADVSLVVDDSAIGFVRTSATGEFALRGVALGTQLVVVRRLGYRVRRVEVEVRQTTTPTRLDVVLVEMPKTLEEVRVEASIDDSKGKLREFYENKSRAQFGYFFAPEDLARDRGKARNASDVMRRVPGAKLVPARFGNRVLFRGCSPLVVIDGQRAVGAELDEITDLDDIAAMEVYPSMAGLPAQYVGYESRCGVIVVWTRVS